MALIFCPFNLTIFLFFLLTIQAGALSHWLSFSGSCFCSAWVFSRKTWNKFPLSLAPLRRCFQLPEITFRHERSSEEPCVSLVLLELENRNVLLFYSTFFFTCFNSFLKKLAAICQASFSRCRCCLSRGGGFFNSLLCILHAFSLCEA